MRKNIIEIVNKSDVYIEKFASKHRPENCLMCWNDLPNEAKIIVILSSMKTNQEESVKIALDTFNTYVDWRWKLVNGTIKFIPTVNCGFVLDLKSAMKFIKCLDRYRNVKLTVTPPFGIEKLAKTEGWYVEVKGYRYVDLKAVFPSEKAGLFYLYDLN